LKSPAGLAFAGSVFGWRSTGVDRLFLFKVRLNLHSILLPAPVLANGDALSALRQLDKPRAITCRYYSLAGASRYGVEFAPLIKRHNPIIFHHFALLHLIRAAWLAAC
jgi:hypothetical protein